MENKNLYISNFKVVKRILKKIGLFLLPVFIIFLFPLLILFFSGELFDIYNDKPKEIFGLSYSYPVKYFKTKSTNKNKPDVLILGSSRSMQFKQEFFNDKLSFYTAAGAINALADFNNYWKEIKVKPKYLILTIDPWWFNESHDNLKKNYYPIDFKRPGSPLRIFINQWKTVYLDFFEGKISFKKIFQEKRKSGILAIMKNQGFLKDGSYQYSKELLSKPFKKRVSGYLNDAKTNGKRFESCKTINSKALDLFFKFVFSVESTSDTKIFMINPSISEKIRLELDMKGHSNYFFLNDSIQNRLQNTSLENNYYYSVYTSDIEMIDGIHPYSETIEKDLKTFAEKNSAILKLLK